MKQTREKFSLTLDGMLRFKINSKFLYIKKKNKKTLIIKLSLVSSVIAISSRNYKRLEIARENWTDSLYDFLFFFQIPDY